MRCAPLLIRQCLVRRCPICRVRSTNIYAKRVHPHPRQKLIKRLVRNASTREVWICAHWQTALDEVMQFVQCDSKHVVVRRIGQSAMFPACGEAVTIIWMHPRCFFTPALDNLNMHRAFNAAGQSDRNLHIVYADTNPDLPVLKERCEFVSKRRIEPLW